MKEIRSEAELVELIGEPLPRVRDKARPAPLDLDLDWLRASGRYWRW